MPQDIQSLLPGALRLIAEQNKVADPQPAGWVADRVPSTGAVIYRVYATPKDQPNGPVLSVTIDEQGKAVDVKALAAGEKVELFPPFPRAGAEALNPQPKVRVAPTPESASFPEGASFVTAEATLAAGGPAAAAAAVAVTINPSVNDLKLMPGQVFTEDIHVVVPPAPDPLFDVYFLADTTGSMSSILSAVKAGAANIMNTLHAQFPNMAFGVGNYKDFASSPPDPYCFQHQQSPVVNTGPVQAAINTWTASGGGDTPEGQFFALNQIATSAAIGWRPGAKRIVVWFGDAPGHDPICAGLPGVGAAITEAIVKNNLTAAGIKVLAISTVTGPPLGLDDTPSQGSYPCANIGTAGQGTRIATATGGSYTSGVNAGTISATIISTVTAAAVLFNNIKLVPTGATAPFVTSINPAAGYGPVDNKGHDYVFKVTFTGPPCKNTDQVFTGTIDVVGDGKVLARKTVRLTVLACERYSYGVKFLCGHVKESPPHVVPLTPNATLRPGVYATEVNILNYHNEQITVHKYLYPLVRQNEPFGREPRSVGRRGEDAITLPAKSATFDDCARIHEILREVPGDEPLSIYYLEIVSPVELTVTAVYTANDLRGVSVSIDVEQIEGKQIDRK
ncbi:MAG TPA: hypothetical protein VF659_06450 [Pyrinomonadaceae bacterium]|jgi:hypothetical protein